MAEIERGREERRRGEEMRREGSKKETGEEKTEKGKSDRCKKDTKEVGDLGGGKRSCKVGRSKKASPRKIS